MQGASLEEHISRACHDLTDTLMWLNDQKQLEVESKILAEAVGNSMANVKYEFLEDHGPHRMKVTVDNPIVPRSVLCSKSFFVLHKDVAILKVLQKWCVLLLESTIWGSFLAAGTVPDFVLSLQLLLPFGRYWNIV